MPNDNDTTASNTDGGIVTLDGDVRQMISGLAAAREERDLRTRSASERYDKLNREVNEIKAAVNVQVASQFKDLDDLVREARRVRDEENNAANEAYNLAVHGDVRGPQFNSYGDRNY